MAIRKGELLKQRKVQANGNQKEERPVRSYPPAFRVGVARGWSDRFLEMDYRPVPSGRGYPAHAHPWLLIACLKVLMPLLPECRRSVIE